MQWFVFQCRSSREVQAQSELGWLDMSVLLPLEKYYPRSRETRSKRRVAAFRPIWSGYIIGGAEAVDWPALGRLFDNPAKSLLGALTIDGVKRPLSPAVVEEIRNRSWVQLKPFDEDDQVRVQTGPWAGQIGTVLDLTDSSAQILIDVLGKSVKADFQPDKLEKVE